MTDPLTLSNQRVQRLRRLVSRRDSRRAEGVIIVEGAVLLEEAVDAGCVIECQFVGPGATAVGIEGDVHHVASGVLEKVASTETPQQVIGIVRMPASNPSAIGTASFVVVADGIADPGNLGTMMRSAAGAGADAFVVTPGSVDFTSPKVVRASAGCIFRLPVVELPAEEALRDSGLVSIGTSSHRGHTYTEVDLRRRVALIFGNEPRGLDGESRVDEWVSIPLAREVESLNVAMASAVLCFEVARQRRSASDTVGSP